MSINKKTQVRGAERRRKRTIIPIIYFLAEVILAWLVLALIQVEFNMFEWNSWAVGVFIIAVVYSTAKTMNVFKRQKDYSEVEDE